MLNTITKSLALTVVATFLFAATAFAQGYQLINAAPFATATDGTDGVYWCENGVFIGNFVPVEGATLFREADGFFGPGAAEPKTFAASLTMDCQSVIASVDVTTEVNKWYQFVLAGVPSGGSFAPNPDDQNSDLQILWTDLATPVGITGAALISVYHAVTDLPDVTAIVRESGTTVPVGPFGSYLQPVPFPAEGTATLDLFLSSDIGKTQADPIASLEVDLSLLDGQSVTVVASGFADPSANMDGPAFGALAVFADGTTQVLGSPAGDTRMVTLTLNTASLADTTSTSSTIEIRGSVGGVAPFTLPDGNVIDWSSASTLEMVNVGGDYWELTFEIPNDSTLDFKFFSQQVEDTGAPLNGGWETGDNHQIAAGTGDVNMGLHFFNGTGVNQDYDWRPYEPATDDSTAIYFRVFMNTEDALTIGYMGPDGAMVGVRGDSALSGGGLNWGFDTNMLSSELTAESAAGYHVFSGVVYFGPEAVGQTALYKFHHDPGDGWESGIENREFVVPESDTTLHWVYFNNSNPLGAPPVSATVLYGVDLTPLETIGIFDRGRGDTLEVRGDFNGWDCSGDGAPDDCLLDRVPGGTVFEAAILMGPLVPGSEQNYKFYLNLNDETFREAFNEDPPSGWEEPLSTTGANRKFEFEGNPDADQDLGIFFFNDILPGNIVPGNGKSESSASIDITFTVDMAPAVDNVADPFDPAADTVSLNLGGDPIWAFTQGLYRDSDGNYPVNSQNIVLEPTGNGMIYAGTFTLVGPSYAGVQYKYSYGGGTQFFDEPGGTTAGLGRRRTRFVPQNADGSFPTEWPFPQETFLVTGNLPFEQNPAAGATAVEPVGTELPAAISLGDNYPNPFNPTTTFEYSITSTQHVLVQVFDLTGRLVDTLIDGVQPASTYRVTFGSDNLASGVYIYQLRTAERTISKKMLLLK